MVKLLAPAVNLTNAVSTRCAISACWVLRQPGWGVCPHLDLVGAGLYPGGAGLVLERLAAEQLLPPARHLHRALCDAIAGRQRPPAPHPQLLPVLIVILQGQQNVALMGWGGYLNMSPVPVVYNGSSCT